ncbi:U4/U6.U5 small nuclear ribonucleoprotein 27 kDa protein [Aphelenchoides besseyi]|nr:U4/U6.U5 small nuclear ribonucleoprotein 27 kDa protein [Aphelenchoides besseyi]
MSSADVDRKRRRERDNDDVDERRSERKRHRHDNNGRDSRDNNGRDRSDYRDRHYDERNKRRHSRTRSNSRERQASKKTTEIGECSSSSLRFRNKIDLEAVAVDEEEMMRQMGFAGFDTTKNKKVEGNVDGVTKVNKSRKYRQYMNRKGGFNRPLDYIA